jgi:hypothetical protein
VIWSKSLKYQRNGDLIPFAASSTLLIARLAVVSLIISGGLQRAIDYPAMPWLAHDFRFEGHPFDGG